jgi:hypothetical protein
MVERWMRLDPEEGGKKLGRLVEEIESGFSRSESLR